MCQYFFPPYYIFLFQRLCCSPFACAAGILTHSCTAAQLCQLATHSLLSFQIFFNCVSLVTTHLNRNIPILLLLIVHRSFILFLIFCSHTDLLFYFYFFIWCSFLCYFLLIATSFTICLFNSLLLYKYFSFIFQRAQYVGSTLIF